MMKTRVERWGNSLAVRIPPSLATETGLAADSLVELAQVAGKLVITPASRKPTLEELLQGITPENLHGEWETGPAVGGEVW
jgi:antitoxin MazE